MILPKISIITPSFNQGRFIEETILSVIGQNYPSLEYIIIDGGSTDNTIDILKKYDSKISYWISERDLGQSDAINKGFRLATGDILGWLNSDDLYFPNIFQELVKQIQKAGSGIFIGECLHFNLWQGGVTASGSMVSRNFSSSSIVEHDFIIQPSSFWTRDVWEYVKELRTDFHYGMDWEWFLRANRLGVKFIPVNKCLSLYRIHEDHKSGAVGKKRQMELLGIYQEYSLRLAPLYNLLMNEKLHPQSFSIRLLHKFYRLINSPKKFEEILRIVKHKYASYSTEEIENCSKML